MKKAITVGVTAIIASGFLSAATPQAFPSDPKMETEIQKIISRMTLEEKVGQMCELTLGTVKDWENSKFGDTKINHPLLQEIISKYKVGSFLNTSDEALTPEQWYGIVKEINDLSIKEMGIPDIYGLDMNHGASYAIGATLLPQNINIAATFNRAIAHRGGEITAYETRACNVPWTYNPTVDLARNPLWPRFWENYGEDAFLSAALGTQTVLGMQGNDPNNIDKYHIAANLKHFMGYGSPVSGKDRTHSAISEMEMREKHFAPYLAAVRDGKLLSIMVNSTTNFGVPFHANAKYLTKWMKDELNWDGLIVTDWADINNLYTREFVAKDRKDAIRIAINAGIDMSMDPYNADFCTLLIELVNEGKVPMSRIDDAVARVLRMKFRLNLFKEPNTKWTDYPLFGGEEFAKSARQAATESMVLLKNENILPLRKGMKILVTGPNANSMRSLNGGWTYTWQGHMTDSLPIAANYKTILRAVEDEFGKENVIFEPAITYGKVDQWQGSWGVEHMGDLDKAVAAAAEADVILACIGETSYCETVGNIDDLSLSPGQTELVKRLYATGKPVVLLLNQGRPRLINALVPDAKAIVHVGLPSNYGGEALAALLSGRENFSGKLPFSYPKYPGAFSTYDYKRGEETATVMDGAYNYQSSVDLQWRFGEGLSYTTFKYSNLRCDKSQFNWDDMLTFSVDVTNTGNVKGMESVLLFSTDLVATVSPDVRRLRQFEKIELNPGETKTVTLKVPASELAYVGFDEKWILEEGDFKIAVADQSIEISTADTHVWETPNK